MTVNKAVEYRIIRQLLRRREGLTVHPGHRLAERLITTVAVVVALVLIGSYLQELLWVLFAAGAILTTGLK